MEDKTNVSNEFYWKKVESFFLMSFPVHYTYMYIGSVQNKQNIDTASHLKLNSDSIYILEVHKIHCHTHPKGQVCILIPRDTRLDQAPITKCWPGATCVIYVIH